MAGEVEVEEPVGPRLRPTGRDERWITVLAFVALALPFVVLLVRLLTASTGPVTLPDDLALLELHTRDALHWRQQLGPFDRFGWNHPGPAYFYWLALVARVVGSGARALFVGATLLNGLVALACLGVVRRRTTPVRTLWAALVLSGLVIGLGVTGPGATTYSESPLGALVSPWNPMVVIVPLVLLVLLASGAVDRSGVSWLGALAVASFVVQTNISTLPLVAAVLVLSGGAVAVTAARDRRDRLGGRADRRRRRTAVTWGLGAGAAAVTVLMWVPPVVQQLTGSPGNLSLIVDFFTAGHPGPPLGRAVWATVAVVGSYVLGPTEVMAVTFTGSPDHAVVVIVVTTVVLLASGTAAVVGMRAGRRYGAALGVLTVVGIVAVAVSVTRVTGPVYGYLVVWAVALPAAGLLALGTLPAPRRWAGRVPVRIGLGVTAVVLAGVAVVGVLAVPPLARASDPAVGTLTDLVASHLRSGEAVSVTDADAGAPRDNLYDLERFVGLVNQLDARGYTPRVSPLWRPLFGPRLVDAAVTYPQVVLETWTTSSTSQVGYLGRVGDMAVVLHRSAPSS